MNVVILVLLATVLLFGFVVLFGAPYLPTRRRQIESALDLLNLKEGQTMLELGSGDGRVLRAAAKRGLNVVGYELNPVLVIIARLNTWRYRDKVRVIWGNYWRAKWPQADGIFVFLLDQYMGKLNKTITQKYPGRKIKLVSFAFKIPNKKITKEQSGVYMYTYH